VRAGPVAAGLPSRAYHAARGTTGNAVLGQKVVHGKQDPATLIAVDGSKCIVPEKRFREVVVGEKVVCGWGQ
jgi:hypothetical protein